MDGGVLMQMAGDLGSRLSDHILVAEDEADIRELLSLALGGAGYSIETAPDGRVALEKALATPPRLLITDLRMPRMDGLDLIRAIRAEPTLSSIPVILFTAYVVTDSRVHAARRFERVDVVTKGHLSELRRGRDSVMGDGTLPSSGAD